MVVISIHSVDGLLGFAAAAASCAALHDHLVGAAVVGAADNIGNNSVSPASGAAALARTTLAGAEVALKQLPV